MISELKKLPVFKIPQRTIRTDLCRLLESNRGADVFFIVAGEIFCAHKCILAARSPVFRTRFSNARQQHHQEIKITDVEPGVFKSMLQFIYTGNLSKEEQVEVDSSFHTCMPELFMVKMLTAAHQYELKGLKKICESHILEKVSTESVVYLLHLAFVYDAAELKAVCLRFLAENEVDIVRSYGSEQLQESCPSLFLDLIGYKANPSTEADEELNLFSKILYAVKGSVFGLFQTPYAEMKHT